MIKRFNAILAVLCAVCISLTNFCGECFAEGLYRFSNDDIESTIHGIVTWKEEQQGSKEGQLLTYLAKNAGSTASDWYAFGLGRTGQGGGFSDYTAMLGSNIRHRYENDGGLDVSKATEWHRVSLALLALGKDPESFVKGADGRAIDLVYDGVFGRENIGAQGVNGYIWGLITIDAMRYPEPENAVNTREKLITEILKKQCPDGGFTLDGSSSDIDITAMAIQALAPYYNDDKVYEYKAVGGTVKGAVYQAIDRGLAYLSARQDDDGRFDNDSSESISQVIAALCSLGIEPEGDVRFIKSDGGLIDGLMFYKMEDGGFAHSIDNGDVKSNYMSGEQALYSLCALYRHRVGMRNLFDMRAEQSESLKSQIKSLDEDIKSATSDSAQLQDLAERYNKIQIDERMYVHNYRQLTEKLDKLGLKMESVSLADYKKSGFSFGSAEVVDIFKQKSASKSVVFDENDLKKFNALPNKLTGENYDDVVMLYEKLQQAENAESYVETAPHLEQMYRKVSGIKAEIESINEQIADKLYPFDDIGSDDKEIVFKLMERVDKLSEYDREQVLGYDDLVRADVKLRSSERTVYITAAVAFAVIICISVIYIRRRKSKANKKVDNEDW